MSKFKERIMNELSEMNMDKEGFINAHLINNSDIYKWEVTLRGPKDTLYESGFFDMHIILPDNYPFRAPKFKFLTKIFHPNIDPYNGILPGHMYGYFIWEPFSNIVFFN